MTATVADIETLYREILRRFTYCPVEGILRNRNTGKPAGYTRVDGYIQVRVQGVLHYAHRLIWLHQHGRLDYNELVIDHIDGDTTNNKIANLREVTLLDNNRNLAKPSTNTSGTVGVGKVGDRWRATISIADVARHLGTFDSIEEAKAARQGAERALGFHANHGR